MDELIHIDGSIGGGQVLRSALSLSALTGKPFVIESIRMLRERPGLMRQHLTAVQAVARICGAELRGAELGSTRLEFRPGPVQAGDYEFPIGSAGSACLVLQTVLPPLAVAGGASQLVFEGGTHNPLAPPYPFLDQVFLPIWEKLGLGVERELVRAGFYPAGGGRFRVRLEPVERVSRLDLLERGSMRRIWAEASVSNLPIHIARRELEVVKKRFQLDDADLLLRTPEAYGPGNVLTICAEFEHATEMVVEFGAPKLAAERLAERAVRALGRYLASGAAVGEHLSDQLLVPLAMAGSGSFSTLELTEHARSNISVIERFMPVKFQVESESQARTLVKVHPMFEARDEQTGTDVIAS
ncbi:MAG: RNA 3'-terminal phosphate cyclase [Myxococcales bacterium]